MLSYYKYYLEQLSHNKDIHIYQTRVNAIENNLAKAKNATIALERDRAYLTAVKALRSDIKELSSLIKSHNSKPGLLR
jgi:hypothetical protein